MHDAIEELAFKLFTADTGDASRAGWEAFANKDRYMRLANVAYTALIPPTPTPDGRNDLDD